MDNIECLPFPQAKLSKLQKQILLWIFETLNSCGAERDGCRAFPSGYKLGSSGPAVWDETPAGPAVRWQHRRTIFEYEDTLSGVTKLPDKPQALSRALARLEQRGLVTRLTKGQYTSHVLLTIQGMAVANNLMVQS